MRDLSSTQVAKSRLNRRISLLSYGNQDRVVMVIRDLVSQNGGNRSMS